MSDKEKKAYTANSLNLAVELATAALKLCELMDFQKEGKILSSGEKVKLVTLRLDYIAEEVRQLQLAALYAAEEIRGLANVIEEAEDSPELEAARLTMEHYAAEIEAAKKELKEANDRAGRYADLYENLLAVAADTLTPEQRQRHKEFKARITGKAEC